MSEKIDICLPDKSEYCCQRVNLCLADVWYLNKSNDWEKQSITQQLFRGFCEKGGWAKVVVLLLELANRLVCKYLLIRVKW